MAVETNCPPVVPFVVTLPVTVMIEPAPGVVITGLVVKLVDTFPLILILHVMLFILIIGTLFVAATLTGPLIFNITPEVFNTIVSCDTAEPVGVIFPVIVIIGAEFTVSNVLDVAPVVRLISPFILTAPVPFIVNVDILTVLLIVSRLPFNINPFEPELNVKQLVVPLLTFALIV